MKCVYFFMLILTCKFYVLNSFYSFCPSSSVYIVDLGMTVNVVSIASPNFQSSVELCFDQMRPVVYLKCLTSVLWTNPNITQNCVYTDDSTNIDYIKNIIENQNSSSAIMMLENLPYSKFLVVDVSNLIHLFENIVQSVNSNASFSSSTVAMIKYNIFNAYSILMNQTSSILLKNSSLPVANKLLMGIDYVAENMIVATDIENEYYETDEFIIFIFPVLQNKPISDQTFGIYTTQSPTFNKVAASACKSGNCSIINTSTNNNIGILINPYIVNYMSFYLRTPLIPHINFIVYKNSAYFAFTPNSTLTVFGTQFSTTISNYSSIYNQINSMDFIYVEVYADIKNSFWYRNSSLAYYEYNDSLDIWSTSGCRRRNFSSFACNHLTPFSVLMDIQQIFPEFTTIKYQIVNESNLTNGTYYLTNGTSTTTRVSTNELILSIMTYSAIGLSLIGLLITMLTFSCFKKLRKHYSQKCIFNLSLALFLMYSIFIINSALVETGIISTTNTACVVLAFLLHYFLLATFVWMLVISYIQYVMFIKVFPFHVSYFTLKAALISWTIPLIPTIISVILNYTPSVVSQMTNNFIYGNVGSNICWIQGLPFYLTVVLPIGIIILLNIIVFIRVTISLICNSKASNELQEDVKIRKDIRNQGRTFSGLAATSKDTEMANKKKCNKLAVAVFSCFVVLGITWIFGFMGINEAKVVFSYLFCLFNAAQGFLVLIAYVLMSKPKREMWAKKLQDIKSKFNQKPNYARRDVKDLNYASSLKSNFGNNRYKGKVQAGSSKETKSSNSGSISSTSELSDQKFDKMNVISYAPNYLIKTDSLNSNQSNSISYRTSGDKLIRPDMIKKRSIFSFLRPNSYLKSPEPEEVFIRNQKKMLNKYPFDSNIHHSNRPKPVISRITNPEVLESFSPRNLALRKVLGFEEAIQSPIGIESLYSGDNNKPFNRVDSSPSPESFVANRLVNPAVVFVKMQPNIMSKINL